MPAGPVPVDMAELERAGNLAVAAGNKAAGLLPLVVVAHCLAGAIADLAGLSGSGPDVLTFHPERFSTCLSYPESRLQSTLKQVWSLQSVRHLPVFLTQWNFPFALIPVAMPVFCGKTMTRGSLSSCPCLQSLNHTQELRLRQLLQHRQY